MSAYLKFFELEQSPFEGKAQAQVVLGTKALREAFALIRSGLDEGDARICVSGGAGLGKTSLARALPKLLGDSARVAVVLDPDVSWETQRGSIAKQWGLTAGGLARATLIEAARDRRLVLVIDQAERASEEFLDHLDIILSYRSENDEPVVQSILLARLSGRDQRDPAPILWWLDRIQTLQLEFAPLPRDGIESYIHKHLKRAGWRGERLFTEGAALAIHGYTGGIPGEVSKLCERLLAEAAARDRHDIDDAFVHSLCDEHEAGDPFENESELEDEFEDLVLGEEFDDADQAEEADATVDTESPVIELKEVVSEPERTPTLAETLEHFEPDAADAEDEVDEDETDNAEEAAHEDETDNAAEAADEAIEDPWEKPLDEAEVWERAEESLALRDGDLSAPASPEELRAILGSVLGRHARAFAAAAIAAVIGGLAFAWLSGDAGPSEAIAAGSTELAGPERAESTQAGSSAHAEAPPAVLARLRGPVSTKSEPAAGPKAATGIASAKPQTLELADEEPEEEITDDDGVDMRPAAMVPGPGQKSPSEDRFW
jgi:type II secretory pathway predicted ATPase ExeA